MNDSKNLIKILNNSQKNIKINKKFSYAGEISAVYFKFKWSSYTHIIIILSAASMQMFQTTHMIPTAVTLVY